MTLVTIVAGGIVWFILRPLHGAIPAMAQTVFVGLSALTVPHMVFTELASASQGGGR